eukprot:502178-Alexandrium_andersonii.AAC.1
MAFPRSYRGLRALTRHVGIRHLDSIDSAESGLAQVRTTARAWMEEVGCSPYSKAPRRVFTPRPTSGEAGARPFKSLFQSV